MKKQYLLMAAFASALAFTACSNEDDLGGSNPNPVISEVVEGATFEIAISNTSEGSTKATRPMTSSAADNNVNKIKLVMYKRGALDNSWSAVTLTTDEGQATNGTLCLKSIAGYDAQQGTLTDGIISYDEANVDENVPGTDQHITKRAKIEVIGLQPDTKYQIVAYGYNDTYPYGVTATGSPATTTGFENGVFKAEVGTVSNPYKDLEEIFAATDVATTVEVTEGEQTQTVFSVQPSLTLTRQVAGMLAYFKNVPIYLNDPANPSEEQKQVAKLQVVASHKANDFYFPAVLLDDSDFNGIINAEEDDEEILMTFDFSKIATNYSSHTDADFYTFNGYNGDASNLKKPQPEGSDNTNSDMKIQENTIFGARYLLPFDKHYSDKTTLVIRFLDEDDNLLEERRVTTNQSGVDQYAYDIRCNNFYSIGTKMDTDEIEDPDIDDPMDLTGNEIMVVVNDAWDVLHNMGIE